MIQQVRNNKHSHSKTNIAEDSMGLIVEKQAERPSIIDQIKTLLYSNQVLVMILKIYFPISCNISTIETNEQSHIE